jgi:phosphoribosylformimino-5-aminoimidazole carboxamide ribotide isomerase
VAVEGKGEGVDWEPVKAVIDASPKPVIISGGVSTMDDVMRFKDMKAYGIIIGSALYSNRIDFPTALVMAQ